MRRLPWEGKSGNERQSNVSLILLHTGITSRGYFWRRQREREGLHPKGRLLYSMFTSEQGFDLRRVTGSLEHWKGRGGRRKFLLLAVCTFRSTGMFCHTQPGPDLTARKSTCIGWHVVLFS